MSLLLSKKKLVSDVESQHLRKSTPASCNAPNAHPRYLATTLPRFRTHRTSRSGLLTDDLTVYATVVKSPELEASLNNYLDEITDYMKDTSLLISATNYLVTLLKPDTPNAKTHPIIFIEDSQLPWVQCRYWESTWAPRYHSTCITTTYQRESPSLRITIACNLLCI